MKIINMANVYNQNCENDRETHVQCMPVCICSCVYSCVLHI